MPAAPKLKHRRGAKKKSSRGGMGGMCSHKLRLILIAAILIVLGVMTTLLGGLMDALNRQKEKLLVHKELDSGSLQVLQNQRLHELSLHQQEIERERRMADQSAQRRIPGQHIYDAISNNIAHLRGRPSVNGVPQDPIGATIPDPILPPPEQLGGPYPYPMESPPDGYDIKSQYNPAGGFRYAEYTKGEAPYKITEEIRQKSDAVARVRREYVKKMMEHGWKGYAERAFGKDEIKPVSGNADNNWGGLGIQLVDCLDTLWLLGMKDEFFKARDWVRDQLNHNVARQVSVFETTIRSLGGLLAAYDWSGDKAFLDKALDLGERLGKAYASPTGIPYGQINLATGRASNIGWARGNAILSEFGSMQLEFRMLDESVHNPETAQMRKKSEEVFEKMHAMSPSNGLFPYYLSNGDADGKPRFRNDHLTFGAMADSFYEYMLKVWLQGGKVEPLYREMYDKAMQGMHNELVMASQPSGLVYIADKIGTSRMDHKMDHLVCFMGGLLALGAYTDPLGLDSPRAQRDLKTGRVSTGNLRKSSSLITTPSVILTFFTRLLNFFL